jgi:hypothetical protein
VAEVEARVEQLEQQLSAKPWKRNLLIPSPAVYTSEPDAPFMAFSTCSAADFFHPRYSEISESLDVPVTFHRKYWEWVFIVHTAISRGLAADGKSALGFGVGAAEPIAAALAARGMSVVATDAPPKIGVGHGWSQGDQYAAGLESLRYEGILDADTFFRRVTYDTCDMNDIAARFRDHDFIWSSCCLEHLGGIERGLAFVVNSVERTLRVGGIACHTTEFNLSSNDATVERGATVIFRKRDLDALTRELRARGHRVSDVTVAPDAHHLDAYVDTPPYSQPPHLRLELEGYASTSLGLVIERGA